MRDETFLQTYLDTFRMANPNAVAPTFSYHGHGRWTVRHGGITQKVTRKNVESWTERLRQRLNLIIELPPSVKKN